MTRLSGRVPETGTAISGATVAIIDTQGTDDTTQWSIVASDTTDANGEWSVSGLEPSAVERYHAVAQFDSGVEFVNFESLPYLSTPADAFAPTTPVNVGTPTAEVGIPAFFDVTITNTNTPVDEGDILTVDFSANNTGTFQDTQDIRLEIDNVEEDRDNNVTLDGGVSTTGTLQWDTTNETPAQYTATVLSNDDADSVTVQVESEFPVSDIAEFESGSLHPSFAGDTADFVVDSNPPTLTGTNSLKKTSVGGGSITSESGLDRYPQTDQRFACYFHPTVSGANSGLPCMAWGTQDPLNRYEFGIVPVNNELFLSVVQDGSFTELSSRPSVALSNDEWYDLEVDWLSDGSITGRVFEVDQSTGDRLGSAIESISGSDSTYSSGGLGFAMQSSGGLLRAENYRILENL